jgi:hypothetical protein
LFNWGANLQANSVTYTNMTANGTGYFKFAGWNMKFANGVFEDAATRTNYLAPFYIDGANINSNYLNPFAQGTASTANGFVANSTGYFTPNDAAIQDITEGDDGWYIITYNDWTSDTLTSGEAITANFTLGIITDIVDTQIQLVPFQIFNDTPVGKITLDVASQKDATVTYIANNIGYINSVIDNGLFTVGGGPGAAVYYSGYCARNMTANSTVYFTNASLVEKQNKI